MPVSSSTSSNSNPTTAANGTKLNKPTTEPNDRLGKDAFLQLLVAQLKYQNPLSPMDGTEFVAQTAQLTMTEKLSELAKFSEASIMDSNRGQDHHLRRWPRRRRRHRDLGAHERRKPRVTHRSRRSSARCRPRSTRQTGGVIASPVLRFTHTHALPTPSQYPLKGPTCFVPCSPACPDFAAIRR
jgi:Flagellar hook capping protein - N-terminal region